MGNAKKQPHRGIPKISLVYHPSIQMKPSEKSLYLLQRLKELDKDFSIQNKKLRKITKQLKKRLKGEL